MLDPRYAQLLKRTFVDYRQTSEILENPLIMERAEALYYWDIHGRRYFDAITPFSPALGLVQRLFQGVPRESKFLGASQSPERRGWRSQTETTNRKETMT